MERVDFYQLTRDPAPVVLAVLAERIINPAGQARAGGAGTHDPHRLMIVAQDRRLRDAIDTMLWAHRPESFLPHGDGDAPEAADDPILIGDRAPPAPSPNRAGIIALADGQWRDEAADYARVLMLFDEGGIAGARDCWRTLKAREPAPELRYWRQDARGRWTEGP